MVCGNFILPEPASYVFFFSLFNLRNLLYIIFLYTFPTVPLPPRLSCARCSSRAGSSGFTALALRTLRADRPLNALRASRSLRPHRPGRAGAGAASAAVSAAAADGIGVYFHAVIFFFVHNFLPIMGLDSVIRRLSPLYAASAALGMFRTCPRSGRQHTLKKHPSSAAARPTASCRS